MTQVTLDLPDWLLTELAEAGEDLPQVLVKGLAVGLYVQEKVSLGAAAQLAGMSYMDFWQHLAEFDAGPRYTVERLKEDVEALKKLGLL